MNEKKTERLYTAITNIDDTYIEEAQNTRFPKKKVNYRLISILSTAAVFVLVIAGALRMNMPWMFEEENYAYDEPCESEVEESVTDDTCAGEGIYDDMEPGDEAKYEDEAENSSLLKSYYRLILPLTLAEYDSNITASRDVTFDFDKNSSGDVVITDSYILTNSTAKDKKITILYPYNDNIPNIALDGSELKTAFNAPSAYDEYRGILGDEYLYTSDAVIYLEGEITIPAGESVTLSAETVDTQGIFELATELGSNIEFTEQSAVINGNDNIEIIDQSFGFDIDNGVYKVRLNIDEGYYYLETTKA